MPTSSDPCATAATTRDEFAFVPESYEACWRGAWSGDTPAENVEVLENISAAIDWCFNPRDDDASQDSILIDALLSASRFIADQPCGCDPADPHEMGPCRRCEVLGRLADERQDR